MSTQTVARLFGVVFLLVGALGFVLGGFGKDPSMLLGQFPVNGIHNAVHVLFGVWGLMAAGSAGGATTYCRLAGVAYLALTGLAFVDDTTFGLIPIGGNDRWLHLGLGLILSYFGFMGGKTATA